MRVTALTENTTEKDFRTEHGLSLYIETNGQKILFDSGQTELFAENAGKLGIDLSAVDIMVLSHGHYDHGGGLERFMEINKKAPIYMSRYAFEPHYNGTEKYIGLDTSLEKSERIIFTDGVTEISDTLTLYSCNDSEKLIDLGSFGLNMLENGEMIPDDFRHEQYLLINENGKRVLISGCSHKGINNIESWFRPDVLIGGFHFSKLECGDKLLSLAEQLDSEPTHYYTCHCTGVEQYRFMSRYMKRLDYISTGKTIVI
ncbi:MAG: MBL fold metallo-hydrolase [Clostridia bacterium]|nr:MBL fold metallo-hydrolase [Clostridia bacterium]